ncbi:DNA-deoxyinosine glycosylase [Thiomicrorhabdus cannonii]|uniref:DNA-deoxyinosine glycosylase n=1 Tax=Thiomicrorhabdus cannonii TaxID=2748011 RepID=UPI0015B7D6AD|nr:DNA-deoxyinosine glycosylase [Thiomicrorhabdus cannonii]
MSQCNGFRPIEPLSAKVLILGTMPSVESLNQAFYYAHPRNAFWPIMQKLLGRALSSVEEKTASLQEAGIFLWDVLEACHRQGSLDSAIQQPQANDFTWIFAKHPHLKTVIFNGKAAETLFKRHVLKAQTLPHDLQFFTLPSTSPANARLSFEDKYLLWQEKLAELL